MAAGKLSVPVMEPDAHSRQLIYPTLAWYCPTAHEAHGTVGAWLNCPAAQAEQLVAPMKAATTEPPGHI